MNSGHRATLSASVSLLSLLVAGVTLGAAPAMAQSAPIATELDEITVSAEREPGKIYDTPATVSVKRARDLELHQVKRPRDIVADEPGVSVGNQPGRHGATNYVIRGIGENRVKLQIDGVEIPDSPSILVGPGNYTRDYVDFDSLKSVEIVRGPASALYGSDALGGVVSYVTKDPEDFLKIFEKDWYLGLKGAYDSADRSVAGTATVAGRAGPWSGMVIYTRRKGHELDANGSMKPNPQDTAVDNLLAKLVFDTPEAGRWRMTVESFKRDVDTNVKTDLGLTSMMFGNNPYYIAVFGSKGSDVTERKRFSLDWTKQVDFAFADEIKASVFWTLAERTEETDQLRATAMFTPPAAPSSLRFSRGSFEQKILGGEAQATVGTEFWGGQHSITYGFSASHSDTKRLSERTETNLSTGVTTDAAGYPYKQFPDTKTTKAAVFLQDTITFGALRVIPAVRLDYFHLDPSSDRFFSNGNANNFKIGEVEKLAVSPKLGVTYDLNDRLRIVAQYSHGFRAPPYDNANFAYSNPTSGYEILPNTKLKPETSDGFEAGIRGRFENGSSFQATGFYNIYNDFIETTTIGVSPQSLLQFQYNNLSKVVIWGFEAKGEWRFQPEWSLFGSVAFARGQDQKTKQAIDSVDPLTGLVGIRWRPTDAWTLEARVRGAADKTRVSDDTIFKPKGYATVDAMASWDVNPNFSINAGVFNLFDASYFAARDVAGLLSTASNLELYRAPGRSFAVNATIRF